MNCQFIDSKFITDVIKPAGKDQEEEKEVSTVHTAKARWKRAVNKVVPNFSSDKNETKEDKKKDKIHSLDATNDKKSIEKRSCTFTEYGIEINPEISDCALMQIKFKVPDEDSDDDEVYPLSIKYEKNKVLKSNIYRFIFLFLIIICLIPSNFYTDNAGKTLSERTGYFADQIYEKTISMNGINEYKVNTQNCIVYLLENTGSTSEIKVYASVSRSTSVSFSLSSSIETISIMSDTGEVQCYVEIYVPGGVTIPKLSITYNGDTSQNVLLYDYKDGSSWTTPMIITNLAISVSGSYPSIYFEKAHTVSSLTVSGSYCICSFSTMKIASMTFTVSVGSLNINQNSAYTQNSVTVKTPHGTHCVAGATVNTVDSGCPTTATRNSGFTGTYVDTSSYCQSTLYVCSNSAASCPASGTAVSAGQGSFTITLDDGPVQFLIDGSTTTASLTYTPTYDQFAITSQITLTDNKNDFSSYTSDPRIYLYPTVSPGYARMWVHSSLKQYIQARPWLLEILSLSVLSPTYYRNTLIHIPGSSCPYLTANNAKQNTYISLKLSSSVYTDSSHLIAQAANNTYYSFDYTAKGDFIQYEIPILTGNIFILMSVIISSVISVFSVFVVIVMLIRLKSRLEEQYFKYLEGNRNMSRIKKEIEGKISKSQKLSLEQSKYKKVKILNLGLFTSKIIEKEVDFDNNEDEIGRSLRKKNKTSVSFFKVPELYIDKIRRSRSNSFKMFIQSIYESSAHFPEWKLSADKYFPTISARLDLINIKYLEYCTKEGLKPINIENETEILKEFNLMIEIRSDSTTNAYTNIRWKTDAEKLQDLEARKFEDKDESNENLNSVQEFLKSECMKSTFPTDFILIKVLKLKYGEFCREQKIQDVVKVNIVGSVEMSDFGAVFNQKFLVPYIKGILFVHLSGLLDTHYTPGVVRIPKDLNTKGQKIGLFTKFKNRTVYFLFSEEGLLTNFMVVIIHILIILGIPLCFLLATTWSLLQIGTIDQDIYAVVFDINDIFYSSSYNFWLYSINQKVILIVIACLCSWFFLTGLLEVICHYATGARDTGKYIVTRTWLRWITTSLFYLNVMIFILLYTAYMSMILVWCILGAILNPQKFLPTAAGSGVFIVFCIFIISKIKKIEKTLQEVVSKCVDSSIETSLMSSFEKEKEKLVNLILRPVEAISQRLFNQAVNSFMKVNSLPSVDKNITDGILEGDAGAIAMLLHTSCGVEKNISFGLVGMLLQDKMVVMNSIYGLSEDYEFDAEFNVTIAEIAFNDYNPDTQGINQVSSTVILSIKKIISKVFDKFPIDIIDGILQVVFEADPRPMQEIVEKLEIPPSLFKIIVGIATEKEKIVNEAIISLSKELLKPPHVNLFNAIHPIFEGDSREKLDSLAKYLGIDQVFILEMVVAVLKNDTDFEKYLINNEFVYELIEIAKRRYIELSIKDVLTLKNFLLGIQLLTDGNELQIEKLITKFLPHIDPEPAKVLYFSSQGDIDYLEETIDNLGFVSQKSTILEFLALLTGHSVSLKEIGAKIGVYDEDIEVFEAFIEFIITTCRYSLQIKRKIIQEIGNTDDYLEFVELNYNQIISPIKSSLENSIMTLIQTGAINVKGFQKKSKLSEVKGIFGKVFKSMRGDTSDPLSLHNANSSLSKEEISEICDIAVDEILKGETKTEKDIIVSAFCQIAIAFITDVTISEIKSNNNLLSAFKLTSTILGVGHEYLELFLDLISQSPFRLFSCSTPNPKINLKTYEILAEFDSSRLELIADATGYSRKDLKQVIAVWIDSFNLISNNKHVFETLDIVKIELKFDPELLLLMYKNNELKGNNKISKEMKFQIQEFMLKALRNLKQRIEVDIPEPYFENLTTENLQDQNNEFIDFNKENRTNVFLDSPFSQSNNRTMKNTLDFVSLLENIIQVKDCNKKTLSRLFDNKKIIKILRLIKKCILNNDLETFLNLLEFISRAIIVDTNRINVNQNYVSQIEPWQNTPISVLSNKLTQEERSEWLIIQLAFLFCCNRINELLLLESKKNTKNINRVLDDFFIIVNKYTPDEENLIPSQIGLNEVILSLFDSSFFNDLAKRIFYQAIPKTQAISSPESIIGMIVGLTLKNLNLVRVNLLSLIGETKNRVMSGLFAILANDPNQEKALKAISKALKIKSDLVLNLVDAISNEEGRDKYNPLMNICGNYSTSSNIICAIVSVLLEDLSCVRILSERLEVDHQMLSLVLALASRRQDLLRGNYDIISKALNINNESAVEVILELACENDEIVNKLISSEEFEIEDYILVENVLYIDRIGRRMQRPHNRFEIPDSDYPCRIVCEKLQTIFGIESDMMSETSRNENYKNNIKNIFNWIVDAVWGNSDAINTITKKIIKAAQNPENEISKIWTNYPGFESMILTQSMNKLYQMNYESLFDRNSRITKRIDSFKKYLKALGDNSKVEFDDNLVEEDSKIIDKLDSNKKKIAYKIGCTVNIANEYEFKQKYLECETCKITANKTVIICLPCAEFCHAGHKVLAPRNLEYKVSCSCGLDMFPECSRNEQNPLRKILSEKNLPQYKCSLIKEDFNEFLDKKQNFVLNRKLQKENESFAVNNSHFYNDREYIEDKNNTTINIMHDYEGGEADKTLGLQDPVKGEETKQNEFYDDSEVKEKFKEEMNKYKSEDFIIDLVLSLKFDSTFIQNKCPNLCKNRFYTYDESLERYVHLYEHVILLAKGLCRPGFVRMLAFEHGTFDEVYPTFEIDSDRVYTSFMCLVAGMQGDFEYFLRYCKGFMKSLGVKEGSGSTFIQKAARLVMLCYGYTYYTESKDLSSVNNEYQKMFKELFPKKFEAIMQLHKLATMSYDRLIALIASKNSTSTAAKDIRDKELYVRLFEGLLIKSLELDKASIEWTGSLIKVCMGDETGLDFICKAYEISSSKINLYKAICSTNPVIIFPLFEAIKEIIPYELCESIYNLLNGDSKAVCKIIIRKIKKEKAGNPEFENLEETEKQLKKILAELFQLTECDRIDREIFKSVMAAAGIDKDVVNVIFGYNAIINEDEYHASYMLKCSQLQEQIGSQKTVDAIYDLMVNGSERETKKLEVLIESISDSYHLFEETNRTDLIKSWRNSVENDVISCALEALEGDMVCLGFVADNIYSENQSSICTLFGVLSQNRYQISDFVINDDNEEVYKIKILREIMRFYEKIFRSTLNKPEIVNVMYEYELHILLFMCISQDFNMIKYFIPRENHYKFIDQDLLQTLSLLCSSKDYIPDMTIFFKKSKGLFDDQLKINSNIDESLFPIKIENFEIKNMTSIQSVKGIFSSISKYDINSLIEETELVRLEEELKYEITNDGVIINAPDLFRILFKALKADEEAIKDLISLVSPLLRGIPGGVVIYNIICCLTKNDMMKIIHIMPNLVKIMMLAKLNLNPNLSTQEIEEKIRNLNYSESLVDGVVAWISSLVMIINKNTSKIKLKEFQDIFEKMISSLVIYEREIGINSKFAKNVEKQAHFILLILGLCRGNFEMIATLAKEFGVFDEKVKELFSIFTKYKDIIFRNGVIGLPPLKKFLTEAQLKQGLNLAADQAKRALNDALKQGANMVADLAQVGATKMSKAAKAQMEKISRIVTQVPGSMIFADMFTRFDVDGNGFLDYNEFCELCRYMGLRLDKEKTLKLFSTADRDHDNNLELREFQFAMVLLKLEIAYETLKKLGMTTEDLIWFAILGIIFLLLMFTFIFLGIAAFSKAEGFNSVINSLMPMAAGLAAGARNLDLKAAIEKVKTFVEDILSKMKIK